MFNFHTISLKAREAFDPVTGEANADFTCTPLDLFVRRAHSLRFHDGDQATAHLSDGTRLDILFEEERWTCRRIESVDPELGQSIPVSYDRLEEALIDLLSRRNYISSSN